MPSSQPDRYVRWRGTPLWDTIARVIRQLAADEHLQAPEPDIVIGELCTFIDGAEHTVNTRYANVCGVLREQWRGEYLTSLGLECCALLDRGATVRRIAEYLERFGEELPVPSILSVSERYGLAAAIVQAYNRV